MRPKYSIAVSNGWDKRLILEILPFDIPTGARATLGAVAHGVIRTARNDRFCARRERARTAGVRCSERPSLEKNHLRSQ